METRLTRTNDDRMLGGVCGGMGRYFGIDSTLIRLAFAFSTVFLGIGPLIYLLLWVLVPGDSRQRSSHAAQPSLPTAQQDPTGEWRYDPYTGEPIRRESSNQ
jgi:phage shock protein C